MNARPIHPPPPLYQAIVLSTKERAPYLVWVELLASPDADDDSHLHSQPPPSPRGVNLAVNR